ncbi:MAG: hypothetical protein AB3N22_16250 [Ruegeria sp.]
MSLLLSCVLTLTGYSTATARAAAPAVDQVVICIGAQAVLVHVDADGQPTRAPHLCPDCALHLLGVTTSHGAAPVPVAFSAVSYPHGSAHRPGTSGFVFALARAPPA